MLLFPIIYLSAFALSILSQLRGRTEAFLLFIIFGLPIYITTLSVTFMYGFGSVIPVMQWFKEINLLLAFIMVLATLRKKPEFSLSDKLVLVYFLYTALYVLLPIGSDSIKEKMISLKNIAFFPVIYFTGRFINHERVNIKKYFNYICIIGIPAGLVALWEYVTYVHFQTFTGYADFMYYFFQQEPSGNHGLSWTFEAQNNGPKRFASIYANPLDHAAGTLTIICAILALVTTQTKKVELNKFLLASFICSLCSIVFALSRASFASYFLILYAYAYITGRGNWLKVFHYAVAVVAILFFTLMTGDIYEFVVETITFSSSSSVYHLLQWLEGLQSIATHPLGIGLGTSGMVTQGENIGGESQLIIIAVQTGVIGLCLFLAVYFSLMRHALRMIKQTGGRTRRIAVFVFLVMCGMIIPYITAEAMSYVYVTYILWFFAGLMVNMEAQRKVNITAPLSRAPDS